MHESSSLEIKGLDPVTGAAPKCRVDSVDAVGRFTSQQKKPMRAAVATVL